MKDARRIAPSSSINNFIAQPPSVALLHLSAFLACLYRRHRALEAFRALALRCSGVIRLFVTAAPLDPSSRARRLRTAFSAGLTSLNGLLPPCDYVERSGYAVGRSAAVEPVSQLSQEP